MTEPEDHLAPASRCEVPRDRQRNRVAPASSNESSLLTRTESSPEGLHGFEPVYGLPELSVTALRRAGIEKLLPSQKHVLESVQFIENRRADHHRVIISRFAAGKTTLICLASFVAVMRCSAGDSQPPTFKESPSSAELPPAAPPSENSYNTRHSSAVAKPLVLIVVPFPENARDAGVFLEQLLKCHGNSYAAIVGDELAEADFTALRKWPTAVIGTFDRLLGLVEHGYLNLSQLVYLAIDDLDTCLQDVTFNSFLQFLHENLPECQVIITSSCMTLDLVIPVLTLIGQSSPIPAVVRMGRIPKDSTTFEEGKVLMCGETPDGVEKIYRLFDDYLKTNGCSDIDKYIRLAHHHHQTEAERRITLEQLRKDDFCMLITTYKFARAVHIPNVNTAINIHPAKDLDVYRKVCNRVGREGRGLICTLYGEEDMESVEQYKRVFNTKNDYSLVIDGEVVPPNGMREMTSMELLKEFGNAREAHRRKRFTTGVAGGVLIWASLAAYVAQPSNAAGQSSRVARLINGVARIAGNVANNNKKKEGALSREVHTTFLEAGRKATPKTSNKRKATTDQASEYMNLSPTKDGLEWQAVWAAIVEKQPLNKVTNKPFVWLENITKVLMFMWSSPQGVDCVLKMVEAVYRDFDTLKLDAITSASNSKSSVYTLEMRYKRVLSLSKAAALQTAELLLEYKNMADDFVRLEQQTQDPSTELGKEWAKRETNANKETTDQTRSNVAIKLRVYVRSIAIMIAIFGWGVVPLLACATWKFADVSNASAHACLQELANAVPMLRQVCDRLDKNFYRFLRIPGQITQLPKYCLQGMSVKKQDRLSYTIAYHLAAPGEREELGGMLNVKSPSHAGQKKTSITGQKGAKGAKGGKGRKKVF
ncbi:hypothetical protein KCU81_g6723, partial [Aureobasidium melanogenum]|uniref:ATP-dependent RNA helicase n=1 Tax=Aureobasidium melanogenum (strain CBS 110374) TaxID=1043003 RepID=A0A074VSY4_AURM1